MPLQSLAALRQKPSPVFKGIKTQFQECLCNLLRQKPSPVFKGIKTLFGHLGFIIKSKT